MKKVVKAFSKKDYVYEKELKEFRKAQRAKRDNRRGNRDTKRSYNEDD